MDCGHDVDLPLLIVNTFATLAPLLLEAAYIRGILVPLGILLSRLYPQEPQFTSSASCSLTRGHCAYVSCQVALADDSGEGQRLQSHNLFAHVWGQWQRTKWWYRILLRLDEVPQPLNTCFKRVDGGFR